MNDGTRLMGKMTKSRRIAVRGAIAFLGIMGNQLRGPLKHLGPSEHYRIVKGLRGPFNWAPIYIFPVFFSLPVFIFLPVFQEGKRGLN